tara:strand:+ start:1474 stop:1599 length:126 start_codon:yes stop_codon:yes gene_type:complete
MWMKDRTQAKEAGDEQKALQYQDNPYRMVSIPTSNKDGHGT